MKIQFYGLLILFVLSSCITMQGEQMTLEERSVTQILGKVTTTWTAYNFMNIPPSETAIENKANLELLAAARQQGFTGNVEIKNIRVNSSFHALTVLMFFTNGCFFGNFQKVEASGDVVAYNFAGGAGMINQARLGNVLETVSQTLVERLPENSTIAVLNVSSLNRGDSEYIINELEYRLVNSGKFNIVDRRRLDQIRNELDFQMSGDVSDASAISIGNMLGANIVLTGDVSGAAASQWLNIKALDVRTARIIAMAREQL